MDNINSNGNSCPKCKGTGRVMDKNGTIGPCFDCLLAGRMDQHSDKVKDSGLKV